MLIAGKRELTKFYKDPKNLGCLPYRGAGDKVLVETVYDGYYDSRVVPRVSPKEMGDFVREKIKGCRFMGKQLRPWDVVKPETLLDATKVWVGFEMETGYRTKEQFDATIRWLDRNTHRTCYDCEGSGKYPVEVTFYPTHLDEIDTAPITKLIKRAKRKGCKPAPHRPAAFIGSHANISTPESRAGRRMPVHRIRDAVYDLTEAERKQLFGRSRTYGGFVVSHPTYYEFKCFNSTYSMKTWATYCETVRRLAWIIQKMERNSLFSQSSIRDVLLNGIQTGAT